MPAITTAEQLKTLYLSAAELKVLTDWPDTLIEDYLNILSNISMLGEKADDSSDNVQLIHSLISSTDRVRRGLNKQAKEIIEVEQADKSTSRPIRYHHHIRIYRHRAASYFAYLFMIMRRILIIVSIIPLPLNQGEIAIASDTASATPSTAT